MCFGLLLLCALGFFDYFLKTHESQSHGSVAVPEGVAYCAVNPEDGVGINYTVCAYHGAETDLDRIASPFIANGSSDCCLCGMCDDGVLGSGVTAVLSPSPPSSNNFSVSACQVRSKMTVDGSFVCLAHRVTVQSSTKQALALFHFQPQLQQAQCSILAASLSIGLGELACFAFVAMSLFFSRKLYKKYKNHKGQSGSYLTGEGEPAASCESKYIRQEDIWLYSGISSWKLF